MYVFKTFSPLLIQLNQFDRGGESWLDELELFGFKCAVNGQGGSPNYRLHKHSCWELHMGLAGGPQHYEIGGEQVMLSEGEILLIAPETAHVRVKSGENPQFARFGALFRLPTSETYPCDVLATVRKRFFVKWRYPDALRELVDFTLHNLDAQSGASVGILRHCVAIFMQLMLDSLRDELGIEAVAENKRKVNLGRDAEFCESVVEYMKDHPDMILSIERIASHFAISARQLNRRFQAYYGKSCNDIGNQIRSDYARDLLCSTNLSVEEIAHRLGYTNAGNFIRFFKRVEGLSPATFRRDFHSAYKDHP